MIECGDTLRLALETGATLRIGGRTFGENLDGGATIQSRVARFVNLTHATSAEQRLNLVESEPGSRGQRHDS
jgi:hypothetical protein